MSEETRHILLLSDSHGYRGKLSNILLKANALFQYDAAVHLGDGYMDINPYRDVFPLLYQVPGNCDGDLNGTAFAPEICGVTLFMTHGHKHHVKYETHSIVKAARQLNASAALFGHTHKQTVRTEDGVLLVNPGAVMNGDFAVLCITDGKIEVKLFNENNITS